MVCKRILLAIDHRTELCLFVFQLYRVNIVAEPYQDVNVLLRIARRRILKP